MPYLECPGCRLSLYSAASHSWVDDACPVCGHSLTGATKRFPSPAGVSTLCREFPSTPGAVPAARRALDGLRSELGDELHSAAVLLVSELVTNSVRHSKATNGVIELIACVSPTLLRVEISDDGGGFDPPPAGDDGGSDWGHGFQLVSELADRWGRPAGLRTSVWFEIDRAPVYAAGSRPAAVPTLPLSRELRPAG